MAKFLYQLRKNKSSNPKVAGLYFAYAKSVETLNNRKMANHIAEHGSVYTPDVIYGVLEKYKSCIIEMLLNSKKVKIDGLGTFFTTIEGTGAESVAKFDVKKNIKAVHIRFLPEQEHEISLASTEFIKRIEFTNSRKLAAGSTE